MKGALWLKNAVIYQIYPQTFQDSNGDGIGDFRGIIRRLDYIRDLGATAIWLNPCFDSPFGDAGYDIRDFYAIAPRYGDETDFAELVEEAHARGLKVILDLVAGHTSMDHPWFLFEAADPTDPDANRYIWKNRNFLPATGPVKHDFVSNFFWYQPALNFGYAEPDAPWQDPVDAPGPMKNREELRKILGYWFDRGCDGFRVDMAGSLVKRGKPDVSPTEKTKEIWREIRGWIEETYPDRVLMSEWSDPSQSISAGFHLDFMLHFNAPGYSSLFFNGTGTLPPPAGQEACYFDAEGKGGLEVFRDSYTAQRAATEGNGWITLPVGCHDFQRLRCGSRGWEGLRCAWVFFLTQAGPPAIYYGEEIGMRFVEDTSPKEGSTLIGVTAVNAGTELGERAGSRTPMQWDRTDHAGFSTAKADKLYIPLDPDPGRPTVEAQETDPDSLLNFVRSLIQLRRSHSALGTDGSYEILNTRDCSYPMVVLREWNDEQVLLILNPCRESRTVTVDAPGVPGDFLLNRGCDLKTAGKKICVAAAGFGYGISVLKTVTTLN